MTETAENNTEITEKPKVGRPPTFQTPEEMEAAINNYFITCKTGIKKQIVTKSGEVATITQETPLTITDLAYHLGFKDRQSILDYEKRKKNSDEFACIISRARLYIEGDNLRKGLTGEYNSQTNNLNLASNFNYSTKDKLTIDIDEQLQAVLRALPEKYAIQVQAALVSLASQKKLPG